MMGTVTKILSDFNPRSREGSDGEQNLEGQHN